MKMKRFVYLLIVVALIFSVAPIFGGAEKEKPFPSKDIEFIVNYGAGGSTDQFARALAPGLEEALGVNVIVRNVVGGGGAVGYIEANSAKADGYTITIPCNALFTLQGLGHVDFKYDEFVTVAKVINEDYVLTGSKSAGLTTIDAFINYAKSHPGEVQIGHAGVGSSTHMASVALIDFLGLDVQYVPYDGGSASTAAAMGGHVHAVVQHPAEIISGVTAGDLVPLICMSDKAPKAFPNLPTMKERGLDLVISQWRGISVPQGTSEEVKKVWVDAIKFASQRPEFIKIVEDSMLATFDPIYGEKETMAWVDKMAAIFLPIAEANR